MALRVSSHKVTALLQIDNSTSVDVFISIANQVVDSQLLGQSLSEETLGQIELFLAGHFYTMGKPDIVQESYNGASFRYVQGTAGQGFNATQWGQMALTLDTSGRLKNLGKTPATFNAV